VPLNNGFSLDAFGGEHARSMLRATAAGLPGVAPILAHSFFSQAYEAAISNLVEA
jgi:hypothetical protein